MTFGSFIFQKLDELEKEEELRERAGYYDNEDSEEDEEMKEIRKTAGMWVLMLPLHMKLMEY